MKPIKGGYKLWCLGDQHGFIFKFIIYQAKEKSVDEELAQYGMGERILLQFSQLFWVPGLIIYLGNYITSLRILKRLKTENI